MKEGVMSRQSSAELLRALREEHMRRNEALRQEFYDYLIEPDAQGAMTLKPHVTIADLAYTVDVMAALYRLDRQALEEALEDELQSRQLL
jgi:hypothetical protein